MRSPAVVLISFHFHPAEEVGGRRTTALARYLVEKGIRVIVVSAFGSRDIEAGAEILQGIVAVPVKPPRRRFVDLVLSLKRGRLASKEETSSPTTPAMPLRRRRLGVSLSGFLRGMFFRIAYFVDPNKVWAWRAVVAGVAAGRQYGARAVLSSAPPHTVLLAGTLTAKKLGVPHIADFRDPWTDAMVSDPNRRTDYLLQRPLERWVVNSARTVTSTGATVAELLARRYSRAAAKIHVIRNGYDGELQLTSRQTGGRLAILFAGELYLGRNPFPFLLAAEGLLGRQDVDPDRIRITFMGDVDRYADQSVADWLAGKRCAPIIRLLPRTSRERVAEEITKATVLLNFAQNQPLSVPAKTYEHLAAGREILLICERESETARVVAGISGVNQVDPSELGQLENVLFDLYRRHVVEGQMSVPSEEEVSQFSRASANRQFWSIIAPIAGLTTFASPAPFPSGQPLSDE